MYIASKPEKFPIQLFSRLCSFALKSYKKDLNGNSNRDVLLRTHRYCMEAGQVKERRW